MLALLAIASPALAGLLVDADEAARLLAQPHAIAVDTRGVPAFLAGHIPGASRVDWKIGTEDGFLTGKVGPADRMAAAFAEKGVDERGPVVVVGPWDSGWGDEGRVAWDLTWLGHPDVHVLRGGMAAWKGPTEMGPANPSRGQLTAHVRPSLRVDARTLKNAPESYTILDVRTPEEFAGATPYGEAYGGHVPGATNVPWQSLLAGIPKLPADKPVAVYCTGGVRSGMAWALLTDAGYRVANYDGSWWEWTTLYPPP